MQEAVFTYSKGLLAFIGSGRLLEIFVHNIGVNHVRLRLSWSVHALTHVGDDLL